MTDDIIERLRQGIADRGAERLMDEAAAEIERLREEGVVELAKAMLEIERLETALERIEQWSRAYPLEIFPEPDLKKARALLEAGGMTLDAISAHAMRHVVEGVGEIARRALIR